MQKYYNGYNFYGSTNSLFNPTQSLFFLDKYSTDSTFKSDVLSNKITLFQLIDENIKMGDNVLQVLARTREIKTILVQLFSTGEIQVRSHIRPVVAYREIVSQLNDTETTFGYNGDHWDLVLSFMFYYGMITFSQQSMKESVPSKLIIPNAIYREQFLPNVQKVAQAYDSEIATFLTRPSEKSLKAMIWSILSGLDTMFNSYFYETGLQGVIETALRTFSKFNDSSLSIKVEDPYDKTNEYSNSADIILYYAENIYIIGLKRIKAQDLLEYQLVPISTPLKYKHLCDEFERKSEPELLEMELTFQKEG